MEFVDLVSKLVSSMPSESYKTSGLWFLFCVVCHPEEDLGTVYSRAVERLIKDFEKPVSTYNIGRTMLRFIVRFAMQILSFQTVEYVRKRTSVTGYVTINGRPSMEDVPLTYAFQPVPPYALGFITGGRK